MPEPKLGRKRLLAQGLTIRRFSTPAEAVGAFGAMQGQDLPGVLSSVALRTTKGTIDEVIAALNDGLIVRGYPMRGTVFLVPADDLVWMTELMATPAIKAAQRRRGQLGLTDAHLDLAQEIAYHTLSAQKTGLPRQDLFTAWTDGGIPVDGGRGYHLLSALTHQGFTCYGPWNGTDQNVVLVNSWIDSASLEQRFGGDRVVATAELLTRYLTSHGPASLRDFVWWTKLPMKQVKAAASTLDGVETDGEHYWRPGLDEEETEHDAGKLHLLPGFDEFILGYQDRLFAVAEGQHKLLVPGNNGVFKKSIILGGVVIGTWARTGSPGKRKLTLTPFTTLTRAQEKAAEASYASFPFPNP